MAHAQKADLVFQRNERAHLYRWGCQFSRLLAFLQCGSSENDCIIVSKYVDLLPCVSVCHQIPFSLLANCMSHCIRITIRVYSKNNIADRVSDYSFSKFSSASFKRDAEL